MTIKTIRICWIIILAILLSYLTWQAIIPSGEITYESDFSKENYFIGRLLPAERIINNRTLVDEPVYFTVYVPRAFRKASVTINFETPSPTLQIGAEHNKALWIYDFKQVALRSTTTTLEFDLAKASRKKGRYTFMISKPDFQTDKTPITLKNISVTFID